MTSKRPLETDNESSASPTKIRQISNSPKTPNTEDQQNKGLGILESKFQIDLNVLKCQSARKDQNKEDLLRNLNTTTQQLNAYKEKLEKAEEVHRSEMKIIKTTFETKVEEKDKTIVNLQKFVDKAQMEIKDLMDEKGGEDSEIIFNFSNSIQPLIEQVRELQTVKVALTEKHLKCQQELSKQQQEVEALKKSLQEEYVLKDDYLLLQKEKNLFQKMSESNKLHALGEKDNFYVTVNRGKIELLQKEVQTLQDKLSQKDETHSAEMSEVESENIKLKKKLRDLETKYTILSCTPPKVQVRKVFDEDKEKQLESVRNEKQNLSLDFRRLQRKVAEMEEKAEDLKAKLKQSEKRENGNKERIRDLETQIETFKMLEKRFEQEMKIKKSLQDEINNKQSELELAATEFQHREATFKTQTAAQVKTAILKTEEKYSGMKTTYDKLKQAVYTLLKELNDVKLFKIQLQMDIVQMQNAIQPSLIHIKTQLLKAVDDTNRKSQILVHKYKKEIQLRKKLHNTLIELKGNIRVLCRVRPIIREDGADCVNVTSFNDDDSAIVYVNHKNTMRKFEMDRVFKPEASQTEVFNHVQSLITSCLDGYNVCIFAYGQTGSGKTYTMEGTKTNPGINQQALMLLFKETEEQLDWEYTILVSFMEIYNEMLRDLLSTEPTTKLDIKQSKDGIHVPNMTHVKVTCVDEVNEVINLGHRNRITACTDMNERSSRSHSILTVSVIGHNINTNTKITGKLNLVDLAGSERISKSGSEGLRLKEAQNINKSLLSLGDVIHSLKNKQQHVPYRNTKLTYLLQDCLGGDSKTLMVVQVSPVEKNVSETICSLNFAQRVRSVELGQATRKVEK
ncbi:kinesin-like protein KIFC3 [Hydractinia symbiolongicarpus]|uniref:kinesin-like protein KIFC3 n=1 Tax=Hydractinia symbiolongicarpus TaxID=13093 RepID=UPI00254E1818|nr:kinesin-like protein KIFC3 [Hydractinia symbiolongicarpus]